MDSQLVWNCEAQVTTEPSSLAEVLAQDDRSEFHQSTSKRATALLAWIGAKFSDGSECTQAVAEKLASSLDATGYQPPLLEDHRWEVESTLGTVHAIRLTDDGQLVADITITDAEAIRKVEDGTWRNVSLTFDPENYEVQEVSLVAVPAVKGAHIVIGEHAPTLPQQDDLPEEKPEEEPANAVEVVDDVATNAVHAVKNSLNNVERLERLLTNALRREKLLTAQLNKQINKERVWRMQSAWLANGLTSPASLEDERSFMMALLQVDANLYDKYVDLKHATHRLRNELPTVGRRLSTTNTEDAKQDPFIAYAMSKEKK